MLFFQNHTCFASRNNYSACLPSLPLPRAALAAACTLSLNEKRPGALVRDHYAGSLLLSSGLYRVACAHRRLAASAFSWAWR
jgi:hypothetical protein